MVITDHHLEPPVTRELLSRACAGEAQAFCLLVEPHQARLLRQAVALAGELTAAEDLVSETLVEAWKSLPRYDGTCRLSTWLYAILLHRHRKLIRRSRSRPVSSAVFPSPVALELRTQHENLASPELSPAEAAVEAETLARLNACIERLPDKHRNVIRLRFFEDATLSDMAMVLGCSVGTVKSRLHHALERLRKMKMNLPDLKGDTPV